MEANVITYVSAISSDVFAMLSGVVLLVALGLSKGRHILLSLVFAFYPAVLLTTYFPFYGMLPIDSVTSAAEMERLALFFLVTLFCFFVIRPYVRVGYRHRGFWGLIETVALSLTLVGFVIAALYHVVGFDSYYGFSGLADTLFASSTAWLLWQFAPIASILLFVRP